MRFWRVEQDDHRAGGLFDDLLDQAKRMLGTLAESDERNIWALLGGDRPDILDLDLAGDHLVPQPSDDRRHQRQAILPLIRDEHTHVIGFEITHRNSRNVLLAHLRNGKPHAAPARRSSDRVRAG